MGASAFLAMRIISNCKKIEITVKGKGANGVENQRGGHPGLHRTRTEQSIHRVQVVLLGWHHFHGQDTESFLEIPQKAMDFWHKIPDTHDFNEERIILAHRANVFNSWWVVSEAEMTWQSAWWKKPLHCMAARKQVQQEHTCSARAPSTPSLDLPTAHAAMKASVHDSTDKHTAL